MPVQVFDTDAARLAKVTAKIEDILKDLEEYRVAEAGSALLVKERLKLASDTREFQACGLVVEAVVEGQYDPGGRGIIRCYLPTNISDRVNVENGGPGICEVDCPATGDFRFG